MAAPLEPLHKALVIDTNAIIKGVKYDSHSLIFSCYYELTLQA